MTPTFTPTFTEPDGRDLTPAVTTNILCSKILNELIAIRELLTKKEDARTSSSQTDLAAR